MNPRSALACRWAWVGLISILFSLAILLVMPIVRPDLDLLRYPPSFYAEGPWALAQTAAFVAMGLASVAMAAALWLWLPSSAWLHLCGVALVVGGLCSLGLVWFPMNNPGGTTVMGDLHQTAGTVGGVAQLVAALAFVILARTDPRLPGRFRPAVALFGIALASAVVSQVALWWPRLDILIGVSMRLVLAPLLLLWGLVAWRMIRSCAAAPSRSSAAR